MLSRVTKTSARGTERSSESALTWNIIASPVLWADSYSQHNGSTSIPNVLIPGPILTADCFDCCFKHEHALPSYTCVPISRVIITMFVTLIVTFVLSATVAGQEGEFAVTVMVDHIDQSNMSLVQLSFRSDKRSWPLQPLILTSQRNMSSGDSCHFYSNRLEERFAAFSRCTTEDGVTETEGGFADGGKVYIIIFDRETKKHMLRILTRDSQHSSRSSLTAGIERDQELKPSKYWFTLRTGTSLQSEPQSPTIETVVMLDDSFLQSYRKEGMDPERVAFQSFHIADTLFRTLGIGLKVTFVHCMNLQETERFLKPAANMTNLLERSLKYFKDNVRNNSKNFSGRPDALVTFTDLEITDRSAGVAFTQLICSASGGVVLGPTEHEQDRAYATLELGVTLAHELGHQMGFDHRDRNCSCVTPAGYCIMYFKEEFSNFEWTECDRKFLRDQADPTRFKKHLHCLETVDIFSGSPPPDLVDVEANCEEASCNTLNLMIRSSEEEPVTLQLRKCISLLHPLEQTSDQIENLNKFCEFFVNKRGKELASIWWCRSINGSEQQGEASDHEYGGVFYWSDNRCFLQLTNVGYVVDGETLISDEEIVLPNAQVFAGKNHHFTIRVSVALDRSLGVMNDSETYTWQQAVRIMNYVDSIFRQVGVRVVIAHLNLLPASVTAESMDSDEYVTSATDFLIQRSADLNQTADLFLVLNMNETVSFRSRNPSFCSDRSKTIVVSHEEDDDFATAVTIAHEIGHVMHLSDTDEESGCITTVGQCLMSNSETRGGVWSKEEYEIIKSGSDSIQCLPGMGRKRSKVLVYVLRASLAFVVILLIAFLPPLSKRRFL